MTRYIDADRIPYYTPCGCAECTGDCQNCKVEDIVHKRDIDAIPTADVQEVKHGKWIKGSYACGEYEFRCSVCGNAEWHTSFSTPYCPHCGARMDGENEQIH